jgi:chromosome segregation ATPase
VTGHNASNRLAERELELSLWEAELSRREEALRQAGDAGGAAAGEIEERVAALERCERKLQRAIEAVESQRAQLDAVRAEYEARRDALKERVREVEAERDRLRGEVTAHTAAALERNRPLGPPLEAA